MTISDLLKTLSLDDATIAKIEAAMEDNKVYTTGTQGIDALYAALTGEHEKVKGERDTLSQSNASAQKLIKALEKGVGGEDKEAMEAKIREFEEENKRLKAENAEKALEAEIKVKLLSEKAKPDDVDYLIFQLKKSDGELKAGDDGKVRGLDEAIKTIKTAHPSNFESDGGGGGGTAKPLANPLPGGKPADETAPKNMSDAIRQHYEPQKE